MLFLGCVMYLAAQVAACSELFGHLLGWKPWIAGLVIFGILIIYTVISGEVGGILTQAFQGLIMVAAGLVITVGFFIMTDGFGPVLESIGTGEGAARAFPHDALNAWGVLPGSLALAWVILPVLGVVCQPQVLTRMMALKNPRDMPRLTIYATGSNFIVGFMLVAIAYCAIYLVGTGKILPLERADNAVFAVADHLGLYAQLLMYAAVLAAAMSTSSLFLSLAGGLISRDLPSALGITMTPEKQVRTSRIAMSVLGIAAIVFATASGEMVAILGTYGFGTLMVATFPIFIIGLLWKGASSEGVFLGMLTSFLFTVVAIVLKQRGFAWPGNMPWYLNVLTASVVVTILGSLVTRGATRAALDRRVQTAMDL
jgi:Na+/proline symporter